MRLERVSARCCIDASRAKIRPTKNIREDAPRRSSSPRCNSTPLNDGSALVSKHEGAIAGRTRIVGYAQTILTPTTIDTTVAIPRDIHRTHGKGTTAKSDRIDETFIKAGLSTYTLLALGMRAYGVKSPNRTPLAIEQTFSWMA